MRGEAGEDRACLDIEALMRLVIKPRLAAIENEEDGSVVARDERQARRRVDEERRADGENKIGVPGRVQGTSHLLLRHRLAEGDGRGLNDAAAGFATGRAIFLLEHTPAESELVAPPAIEATRVGAVAVQLYDLVGGNARGLMHVVDVLRDHHLDEAFIHEARQGAMPNAWRRTLMVIIKREFTPPGFAPCVLAREETVERHGRIVEPGAAGRAEIRDAAFGRHTGAGEHDEGFGAPHMQGERLGHRLDPLDGRHLGKRIHAGLSPDAAPTRVSLRIEMASSPLTIFRPACRRWPLGDPISRRRLAYGLQPRYTPFMTATIPASVNPVVTAQGVRFGNLLKLALIAGPCALESREHAFDMASALDELTRKLGIGFVFKSSFDKANRTSLAARRGLGLDKALAIFADIREKLAVPVLTDVHEPAQCAPVAEVVDVLQIPAFLCRQTDLLVAAAVTGRVVNVKKGQFLAPWDMKNVVAKIAGAGNPNILVTERGASFGYNTLVSDMRSLPIMAKSTGAPVIFDATHSVQQPGGRGESSGGEREFVPVLARAAVAVGVAGVFIETHRDPDKAPSDGPNMVPFGEMESLLRRLLAFDALAKGS
jgi:2-dehydro-3-deoxyphosphooctonate aldolase (KDO 8-P synthase)